VTLLIENGNYVVPGGIADVRHQLREVNSA